VLEVVGNIHEAEERGGAADGDAKAYRRGLASPHLSGRSDRHDGQVGGREWEGLLELHPALVVR
jgi:hypothetical protein